MEDNILGDVYEGLVVLDGFNDCILRDRVIARVLCRDRSGMVDETMERQLNLLDENGNVRRVNLSKAGRGWEASLLGLKPGQYRLQAQSGGG